VAAAEQADQELLDDGVLADDDAGELLANARDGIAQTFNHLAIGRCIRRVHRLWVGLESEGCRLQVKCTR
jgi:hypothetical protein